MKIGILGSTGAVGRALTEYLLKKNYTVCVVSRHPDGNNLPDGNIHYFNFDVQDGEKLGIFVEKCDVVVNCVAPAYLYSVEMAKSVGAYGRMYMDLTDCIVSEELPLGGTYITSCGFVPGISSILPKFIMDTYFAEVESMVLFQGGNALCSDRALMDIILSSGKSGYVDTCYRNGKPESLLIPPRKTFSVPGLGNEAVIKPFLSHEMFDFARKSGVKRLEWFNAYTNMEQFTFFLRLMGATSSMDRKKIQSLIDSERKKRNSSLQKNCSIVSGDICGTQNGMEKCIRFRASFTDMNRLCAICIGTVLEKVAELEIFPGVYFGYEFSDGKIVSAIKEHLGEEFHFEMEEIPVHSSFRNTGYGD